eukprot:Seg397.20 transcript_id=Seg397.20/GoldUCD/mRNA.D3Y31 product="Ribosomal RNA processing protein 1 B" protein_id=Seg397.20/GoldUCD/D3Y31
MASPKNGGKEHGSIEIYFAKKLANNDKKIRDRAVRRMKAWLSTREGESMTSLDVMKLWKGLFYCMWFSDKPLVQEDLAQALANLLHALKDSVAVFKLIEGFFMTMGREWHGIDRLRLDKFYMLVRKMLKEIFEYLQKKKWNEAEIAGITDVFTNGPCSISSEKFADGIKMFVAETFLDELAKVTAEGKPTPQTVSKLIDPFLILWAQTQNILVFRSIESSILRKLLPTSEDKIDDLEADCSRVAERVFELASKPEVSTKARKVLFKYSKLYKEAALLKEQESNVAVAAEEQEEELKSKRKKSKKRKLTKEEKAVEKETGKKKKAKKQPEQNVRKDDEIKLDENDKSVNIAEETSSVVSTKEKKTRKKEKAVSKEGDEKPDARKLDAVDGEAEASDNTAKEALSFSLKKESRKKKKEGKKQRQENDGKIDAKIDGTILDEDNNKVAISTSTTEETMNVESKKEKKKKKKQEKELPQESTGNGDKKADDVDGEAANGNTSLMDNNGESSFSIISTSQTNDSNDLNDSNVDDVVQQLDFDSSFAIGTEGKKEKKGKRNKRKAGGNEAAMVSEKQPDEAVLEKQSKESFDDTTVQNQSNVDDVGIQQQKREDPGEGENDVSSKPAIKKTKKVSKSATVRRSKRVIERKEMSKEDTETPSSKKKKVIFELSRNAVTSISNLKISPAVVFTPDQKPSKGVLKTSSKRRRASDFF